MRAVVDGYNGEVKETHRRKRYKVTETPGYVEHTQCFSTFDTRRSVHNWLLKKFPSATSTMRIFSKCYSNILTTTDSSRRKHSTHSSIETLVFMATV